MSQINTTDTFEIVVDTGEKGSMSINQHGDLRLNNPARSSGGRALVCGGGDQLMVNYASDFTTGVIIEGQVRLRNLGAPPAGVATDRVVADKDGNLYKLD